jgi:hypothetical protein
MTTTRHIIDITADLVPGFEAEETSEAKNIAYEILEYDHIPDSGDAITAADLVVEALIKAGWRPTVEETAAEHHELPNADAPTDAEVQAAAESLHPGLFTLSDFHYGIEFDNFPKDRPYHQEEALEEARAALLAAREVARHE